jgi:hypothetical protein
MKAISLLQPWASLVAIGAKKIETRSWPTSFRGKLAIHASKGFPKWSRELCPEFAKLLGIKDYKGSWLYYLEYGVGPFGKVIATCNLVDCIKILHVDKYHIFTGNNLANNRSISVVGTEELSFGDYTPGRYAWLLEDVKPLPEPIPAKGHQGLWEWEPPEGVIINA